MFSSFKLSPVSESNIGGGARTTLSWFSFVLFVFFFFFFNCFFKSLTLALESPCCFYLQKNTLNGDNPFDSAQDARTAHFRTSGTLPVFKHFLPLHTVIDLRQVLHILFFSIFSHLFKEFCARTHFMFVISQRTRELQV